MIRLWPYAVALIGAGFLVKLLIGFGIDRERARWEAARAEQDAKVVQALAETRQRAREMEAQLAQTREARDELLDQLEREALASVGADNVCLDAGGVRDLTRALDAIRSGTGTARD